MTEAEWLECDNPQPMLEFLRGKVNDRKLRLFAVSCCIWAWQFLTEESSRVAVKVSELFADGLASKKELVTAQQTASKAELAIWNELEEGHFERVTYENHDAAVAAEQIAFFDLFEYDRSVDNSHAGGVVYATRSAFSRTSLGDHAERRCQTDLLRHIIGNPFRPYPAPDHLPSNAIHLAQALYNREDCGFALHDALLEAGHPDLADHFRDKKHPKGCWALDLILGKE